MPALYVCSLSRLHETVATTGARHLVTLINVGTPVERPAEISADRHLDLGMSDIVAPMDQHVLPGEAHIRELLRFVQEWDRQAPASSCVKPAITTLNFTPDFSGSRSMSMQAHYGASPAP